jgi:hypothetical protein
MKPESYAWHRLREHAAKQLRPGFAGRVLRPGFAQRVLLAARAVTEPSFSSHFALSAATAAVCLVAVVFVHQRSTSLEDARNLAGWQAIASEAQELAVNP